MGKKKDPVVKLGPGGERGIRTPGTSRYAGFQDRCNRPLCHFSGAKVRTLFELTMRKSYFFVFFSLLTAIVVIFKAFLHGRSTVLEFLLSLPLNEYQISMTYLNKFSIALVFICITILSFGQKKVNAYLQTKQLYAPTIGSYVEIHTQFSAPSLKYKTLENGGLQAEIFYHLVVQKGTETVKEIGFKLLSPVMLDATIEDFYDIQLINLEPGEYSCSIELADLIANNESIKSKFKMVIEAPKSKAFLSDIIVAEVANPSKEQTVFTKSEYDIIPRLASFYTPDMSSLPIYIEAYNLNNDKGLTLDYYIENQETKKSIPQSIKSIAVTTNEVTPFLFPIDISKIGTGKYKLIIELRQENGEIITSKNYVFDRQNDLEISLDTKTIVLDPSFQNSVSKDSIRFYLSSVLPICPPSQQKFLLKELKDKTLKEEQMRKLLQAFWVETAPTNTTEAWLAYKRQVLFVEQNFRTSYMAGFDTDRGRVYLQYGAPSRTHNREMSSSELPWEIWEYNKIGNFSNRKFLFYNPDLVSNHYNLLHSDMLGELKNPRWEYELNKRNTVNGSVDDPNEYKLNSWGNNAREIMYR